MRIFSYFRRKAEERKKIEDERISSNLKLISDQAKQDLKIATENMLSKYCAVHSEHCTAKCVHFIKGKADSYHYPHGTFIGEFQRIYQPPSCRLWKN
jgi:hypothetical protein